MLPFYAIFIWPLQILWMLNIGIYVEQLLLLNTLGMPKEKLDSRKEIICCVVDVSV